MVHRLSADPLVAGLLALHDLHPVPLAERLDHALSTARRRLGSHGSGITLGESTPTAPCTSCSGGGCGSDTVKDVVAGAVGELAPDVAAVVFDMAPAGSRAPADRDAQGGRVTSLSPLRRFLREPSNQERAQEKCELCATPVPAGIRTSCRSPSGG